ncbi:ubiquitin-conjugating enzyme [Hypoxylon sp. NC1633]|nr:ubiquitin-conjugating enzyme [Hypoxylon sp. NC1633]
MSSSSQKRISKELHECMTSPPAGMTVSLPLESDIHTWAVTVTGPPNSPYAGGTFMLTIVLPSEYPFKMPQVTFGTRIYHPNVTNDSTGNICLGILKPENWKPASRVRTVLDAVRDLLVAPNPDDPLEPRIAEEYRNQPAEYQKNARAYVVRYAQNPAKK